MMTDDELATIKARHASRQRFYEDAKIRLPAASLHVLKDVDALIREVERLRKG